MMTNVRNVPNIKVLMDGISEGDRDAMAEYLADGISSKVPQAELKKRYRLVWNADHGNDSMVLRNLAITAAASGELEKTEAYARDFRENAFYADSFHSALAIRKYGDDITRIKAEELLLELAKLGHIRSQIMLRSISAEKKGPFAKLSATLFRAFKIVHALMLVSINPDDPRGSV